VLNTLDHARRFSRPIPKIVKDCGETTAIVRGAKAAHGNRVGTCLQSAKCLGSLLGQSGCEEVHSTSFEVRSTSFLSRFYRHDLSCPWTAWKLRQQNQQFLSTSLLGAANG
jgi:hypothetical protein